MILVHSRFALGIDGYLLCDLMSQVAISETAPFVGYWSISDLEYLASWNVAYREAIREVTTVLSSARSRPEQSDSGDLGSWLAEIWQWGIVNARQQIVSLFAMIVEVSNAKIVLQCGPDESHLRVVSLEIWHFFLEQEENRAILDPSLRLTDEERSIGSLLIVLASAQPENREIMLAIWKLFQIQAHDLGYTLVYMAVTFGDNTLFDLMQELISPETFFSLRVEWCFFLISNALREDRADRAEWIYSRIRISREQRNDLDEIFRLWASRNPAANSLPECSPTSQTPPAA